MPHIPRVRVNSVLPESSKFLTTHPTAAINGAADALGEREEKAMELCSKEATKYVWEGSIPLLIHLHESEVTTLPAPPPALILGPRVGYLPLLTPLVKPHFGNTLPPGEDTVWFEYKGLPLKWYIPTGVLFDLLCAEPERPWNLTVHFRGYPGEILTPCEGEDNVKWSYINSLKEAAYIINGNCKNIMNMSQADQFELWQSLVKGNMDGYIRISSRLKLGPVGEDCIVRKGSSVAQPQPSAEENEISGSNRPCRIPVRLYVRSINGDIDELEDVATIDNWDIISYINRPVEIQKEDGRYISLKTAIKSLLPDIFSDDQDHDYVSEANSKTAAENDQLEETRSKCGPEVQPSRRAKFILVRIQGIEPDLDIPFSWVVNNLKNPESFLHICVFVSKTEAS